eukprot:gene24620-biopygen11920
MNPELSRRGLFGSQRLLAPSRARARVVCDAPARVCARVGACACVDRANPDGCARTCATQCPTALFGRNGSGRGPDAGRTIESKETDADRTRAAVSPSAAAAAMGCGSSVNKFERQLERQVGLSVMGAPSGLGETALLTSGPHPVRVRFFEIYGAGRVRWSASVCTLGEATTMLFAPGPRPAWGDRILQAKLSITRNSITQYVNRAKRLLLPPNILPGELTLAPAQFRITVTAYHTLHRRVQCMYTVTLIRITYRKTGWIHISMVWDPHIVLWGPHIVLWDPHIVLWDPHIVLWDPHIVLWYGIHISCYGTHVSCYVIHISCYGIHISCYTGPHSPWGAAQPLRDHAAAAQPLGALCSPWGAAASSYSVIIDTSHALSHISAPASSGPRWRVGVGPSAARMGEQQLTGDRWSRDRWSRCDRVVT